MPLTQVSLDRLLGTLQHLQTEIYKFRRLFKHVRWRGSGTASDDAIHAIRSENYTGSYVTVSILFLLSQQSRSVAKATPDERSYKLCKRL